MSSRKMHCYLIALTILFGIATTVAVPHDDGRSSSHSLVTLIVESETPATRFLRLSNTARDDEEERAGVSAIEKAKALFSSSTITPEKLNKWLNNGKSADTVFSRMKLTKTGGMLFYHPQFHTWVKYVDDLSAKYPTKATSAISTLTTRYGDDVLYKMIDTAKHNPSTEALAAKLQAEQIQHWVGIGKSPDDVFQLFNLQKSGNKLLTNAHFTSWTKFVDDLNAKTPEKATSMLPTLKTYYTDEALSAMVESAKKTEATKSIAAKLESQQLQGWLSSGKTPGNAFVQMGLGKAGDDLLSTPLFSTWMKYMDDFNAQYPTKKVTVVQVFTRGLGDEAVAKMIAAAKKVDATKTMATKFESEQMRLWLASGMSSDNIFTLLKLDKAEDNFFSNPLFSVWTSYMKLFNKENPGKEANLFKTLTTHCSDKSLIKILQAAKKIPSLEATATKLQTEKMHGFLADKKSPSQVFRLLGLDDATDHVIGNPILKAWLSYVKVYNKANPKMTESWFVILRGHHSNLDEMVYNALQNPSTVKMAEKVEAAQLKRWLDDGMPPQRILASIFQLYSGGDDILASPRFETWTKYLDDFNQRFPDKKTTAIDALDDFYGTKGLVALLSQAEMTSDKLATDLLTALLNKWVREKRSVASATNILSEMQITDEVIGAYTKKFNSVWGNA